MKNPTATRAITLTKLILLLACGFAMEMSAPLKMFRSTLAEGVAAMQGKPVSPPQEYQFNNASHETKMTLARLEIDQSY